MSCLSLLQGIFPTQDRTWVSHISGRFFTVLAIRKPRIYGLLHWAILYRVIHSFIHSSIIYLLNILKRNSPSDIPVYTCTLDKKNKITRVTGFHLMKALNKKKTIAEVHCVPRQGTFPTVVMHAHVLLFCHDLSTT